MFSSTKGCAEPMLPFCRLKVNFTLEGKNIDLFLNMYLNIYETRTCICLTLKIYMKCHNYDM